MQSKHAERYMSTKEIATTAKRREGIHATLKAATEAWAGPGILILLFLASLAYVAFGGTLALEASPVFEPETPIAELAVITADTGGALRRENLAGSSAEPADYFPSGYVNRGRDGEGNVMTYEHD
jgi:hypothetical protein